MLFLFKCILWKAILFGKEMDYQILFSKQHSFVGLRQVYGFSKNHNWTDAFTNMTPVTSIHFKTYTIKEFVNKGYL